MSNSISNILEKYRNHGPGPLATSLLLGGAVYGTSRLSWPLLVETMRSIGRPIGRGVYGGGPEGDADWNAAMDRIKSDPKYKRWLPAVFGTMAAGTSAVASGGRGLWSWGTKFPARESVPYVKSPGEFSKTAGFDYTYNGDLDSANYMTSMDWNKSLNLGTARSLFSSAVPGLEDEDYTRHMGTAIVSDAAIKQRTRKPTLGGVFDSAVDKIEKKLTFGGLADVAVRSVVANSAARLFAGTLDSMLDLNPKVRQNIVDAGTWAGAITAILD